MAVPSLISMQQLRARQQRVSGYVVLISIFIGTLLFYLKTLTQVHTFDALSYVTSVEHKPWTEVFHPHHLAYGPLGTLALSIGQLLGYRGGAALPMQIVNATAGASGVTLFFAIVRRIVHRTDIALVAALLLATAYAYWYYAVEIEVYTVAALFLLICLDLLTRLDARSSRRDFMWLGLAQGGAILFHQTNVLFCIPVLIALLVSPVAQQQKVTAHRRITDVWRRIIRAWPYAVTLTLSVVLPYLFVGVVSGFHRWSDFTAWLTEYARTGWWGGPITAQNWSRLGVGLSDTLAQPGGALLWLLLLGLLVLHLRFVWLVHRTLCAVLFGWLVVYGAFFLWWEPDNIEFWIASLPPILFLLVLALQRARFWGPEVWIVFAVALTGLGFNYDSITQRGDPTKDLQRVIARALGRQSSPADIVLVPDGLLELYLPYYEHHDNFLSLNQALFDNQEDWAHACAAVQSRIEAARSAGATALIADEVFHPASFLLARHHVTQMQVDACFAPYRAELKLLPMPAQTPIYWRLPTGQELATSSGWSFQSSAEGWKAAHVTNGRFDAGWWFTPGVDPALISPILNLDARRYRAVLIRLASSTKGRDAQLFYAGPDERIDEQHSIRWTLKPGSKVVTYEITLRGAPGWQGMISRLRIDPVGIGDGGEIRIESVQLVPASAG